VTRGVVRCSCSSPTGARPAVPGALAEARRAAAFLGSTGVASIVVDCESGPVRLGLAAELAGHLGGEHVPMGSLSADALDRTVRRRHRPTTSTRPPKGGLSPMPQGKPEFVPEDGLTTKQRRTLPLTIVHTGHGKGKTTAAFGLALRAWNAGWPIGVFQFVKSAKWKIGEEPVFKTLGALHEQTGQGAPVAWHKMGEGWSWIQRDLHSDPEMQADNARAGWEQIKRDLAAETYKLYLLDEFTYPMKWGWVDVDEVVSVLRERPGTQHVVITGRDAAPALVEYADLVTEMTKIKHPMDAGRKGQRGIEW
jgi:cob(I)alamin adenosyltransferase